jgi:hypothetical protein
MATMSRNWRKHRLIRGQIRARKVTRLALLTKRSVPPEAQPWYLTVDDSSHLNKFGGAADIFLLIS